MLDYNYLMTNTAAAIGLAQLEKVDWHLAQRRRVAGRYRELLHHVPGIRLQAEPESYEHAYWMSSVVLEGLEEDRRDAVMKSMHADGAETRPFFHPLHRLPTYETEETLGLPVAERIGASGISLPSSATLSDQHIEHVAHSLTNALEDY